MTASPRIKFYLWDRTGMQESDNPQTRRYIEKHMYDLLQAKHDARGKELTDAQLRIVKLEQENAELRRMVLEDGDDQ